MRLRVWWEDDVSKKMFKKDIKTFTGILCGSGGEYGPSMLLIRTDDGKFTTIYHDTVTKSEWIKDD